MALNKGQEWLEKQTVKFVKRLFVELEKKMKLIDKDYKAIQEDLMSSVSAYFQEYSHNGEITQPMLYQLRLMQVSLQLEARLQALGIEHNELLNNVLEEFHNEALQFQTDLLKHAEEYGLDLDFYRFSEEAVELASAYPYQRYDFTIALNKQTARVGRAINQALTQSIALGTSLPKLTKQIQEACDMGRFFARRIAQTETSRVYNTVAKQKMKDAGVTRVKWLDSTEAIARSKRKGKSPVCPTCRERATANGGIYPIDQLPPLPAHPHCRCTIIYHSFESEQLSLF